MKLVVGMAVTRGGQFRVLAVSLSDQDSLPRPIGDFAHLLEYVVELGSVAIIYMMLE